MNGLSKYYKQIMVALGCALLMCFLLAIDLGSKALAEWYYEAYGLNQPSYFLGIVKLTYTRNYDVAYGIISKFFDYNSPEYQVAMEIVRYGTVLLAVLIAVMFFTIFRKNLPVRVCLAVVEAGALGNIIDRFCLGYVRDFIDVQPIGFNICNIADFFITGGVVAVVICILFIGKDAVFPLTKKWREEAKQEDKERDVRNGHAGQDEEHD